VRHLLLGIGTLSTLIFELIICSDHSLLHCPQLPKAGTRSGPSTGHFDPLSNPPENFELAPQDFDIDAELIPTDLDQSTGFVLMPKDQEGTFQYSAARYMYIYIYIQDSIDIRRN